MKKAVTITMIFKASALNRDEKSGGNSLTIKKLKRGDGNAYPFISRPAMRHYLWYTLWRKNPERWKPAEVKLAQREVIQFDLSKENTITSAELDLFGYMSTIGETITRKAPLGITKAEGLEPSDGDIAFYSNHELVRRGKEQGLDAQPDLYNKEESLGFFKVSFTLDLERIGVMEEFYKYDITYEKYENNKEAKEIVIRVPGKNVEIKPNKKKKLTKEIEDGKEYEGKIGNSKVKFKRNKGEIYFYMNKIKEKIKEGKLSLNIKEELEGDWVILDLPEPNKAIKAGTKNGENVWIISNEIEVKIPIKDIDEKNSSLKSKQIRLILNSKERESRIKDVLEALHGGLIYHSSTENYGIVPLFLAAAIVNLPIPILHNYVVVNTIERNRFEIDKDTFKKSLNNPYVEKVYVESVFSENEVDCGDKQVREWDNFVNEVIEEKEEVREIRKKPDNKTASETKGGSEIIKEKGKSIRSFGNPILEYHPDEKKFILKKFQKKTGKEIKIGEIGLEDDFEIGLKELKVSPGAKNAFVKLYEKVKKMIA